MMPSMVGRTLRTANIREPSYRPYGLPEPAYMLVVRNLRAEERA